MNVIPYILLLINLILFGVPISEGNRILIFLFFLILFVLFIGSFFKKYRRNFVIALTLNIIGICGVLMYQKFIYFK